MLQTAIILKESKTINAPQEQVFGAWTQPESLHQWWGRDESFSVPIAEVDLKMVGKYRFTMLEPVKNTLHISYCAYIEVSPPAKPVFTCNFEKMPDDDSAFSPLRLLPRWSSLSKKTLLKL